MMILSKSIIIFVFSVILLSGCLYFALVQNGSPQSNQRPNILVIMADDLGWNDISFHGSDQIPTPNIDALAYNGMTLQRHYVLPICTPSRTAFLTGRYPIRTGMQGYPLKAGEPRAIPLNNTLLPEYLQRLGYSTHLLGKWHVGYQSDCFTPAYRGFDSFYGYYNGYITYFNHTIKQDNHTGYDLHNDVLGNLSVEYNYKYITDLLTDRAEKIISNHDSTKPLYLQLSHNAVHSSDSPEVLEVRDIQETNSTFGYIQDFNRRKFAGVLKAMDESVGRVVQALENAKMLENSIIVFMTDNGAQTTGFLENYGSNYPLRGLKFSLFEGAVRGAACIYSPLLKNANRVFKELMHITDWLPTFYSAAGGNLEDLEENMDGVDQWSTLVSAGKSKREDVLLNIDEVENTAAAIRGKYKLLQKAIPRYNEYYGDKGASSSYPKYNVSSVLNSPAGSAIASISGIRLGLDKIIQLRNESRVVCKNVTFYSKCDTQCLFDLDNDPCETKDLSGEHPEIVSELSLYIAGYTKVLQHQTNTIVDPASNPEHFNGTWMPWIESPLACDASSNFVL